MAEPTEFLTRERCYITELVNDPAIGQFSLAVARVTPGITTEWHRLTVDEWYVIRQGEGRMQVGDDAPWTVSTGDVVAIPAGQPQRITNPGDVDLVFECICLPRFTPDAYEPLEPD
jgi:mannose-6-phosphate isomerase-like protein (cupin superfamily)